MAVDSTSALFVDPVTTATGEPRALVKLTRLETLWFNTGTLCNIACGNCYIESSPENDRLEYLSLDDVAGYLDEIEVRGLGTTEVGFTGGEPFMNPDILAILRLALSAGYSVLVLTNAMRPMMRPRIQAGLLDLKREFSGQLTLRVSIDHFDATQHEEVRGSGTWAPMIKGLKWLHQNQFAFHLAGRTRWGEDQRTLRQGYRQMLTGLGITFDVDDPTALILFPEIDPDKAVPEITASCWDILGVEPENMMCATSRMIVKHKGDPTPSVMACTLLAYDLRFRLGSSLAEARQPVPLNHPSCAMFCVLGGGSCRG
jgi:uncharacterized Fe-S cluster-containing radical SAM superfamily protein